MNKLSHCVSPAVWAFMGLLGVLTVTLIIAVVFGSFLPEKAEAQTFTQLTAQMDIGATGINVSNLQTFLAANPSVYPEGLVTGYYGTLTSQAVRNFQSMYGIPVVGRVGPATLAQINSLIASGSWTVRDMSGPGFYSSALATTANSATFTFTTNEQTNASVAYYTNPLMFNEGDIYSNGFGPIGGNSASSLSGTAYNHTVTLSGLSPNTTYYYTVIAKDASGNASVIGPNNSFKTKTY